jgi:D-alanyl-lipoteichoic acid acyltransferase DltB (MBOAT superfamily)
LPDRQLLKPGALRRIVKMVVTFHLVLIGWIFFRADSVTTAGTIIKKVVFEHGPLFWDPIIIQAVLATTVLFVLEIFNRKTEYWDKQSKFTFGFRTTYAICLLFAVVLFGIDRGAQFVYFQF